MRQFRGIFSFLFVALLGVGVFLLVRQIGTNLAPEDSSALFGGRLESGYEYAGYMIANRSSGSTSICSVTYLSPSVGISAAHCVFDDAKITVGNGQFKLNADANFETTAVQTKPGWDGRTSTNDLSIVKLGSNQPLLSEFATIGVPQLGCNYRIVAYGRTETETQGLTGNRPRKSAQLCITNIADSLISIKGSGGGICFGDSGSPVFEEGTNKIVGIISAITAAAGQSKAQCDFDNTAVAVRLDRNLSFVNSASGLNLTANGSSGPVGTATAGQACGTSIGVNCAAGLVCTAGICAESTLEGAAEGQIGLSTTTTLIIVLVAVAVVVGILMILIIRSSRRKSTNY